MSEEKHKISREEFKKIVEQLKNGKDDLFNYYFHFIAENEINSLINKYGASYEDVKDAVIQALYKIYMKLKEDKLEFININHYFSKTAYTELMIIFNKNKSTLSIDQYELNHNKQIIEENNEEEIFSEENFTILNESLKKLNINCQKILEAYFFENKDYSYLANKYQISYEAIRKKKHRCIQKLKSIVIKELKNKSRN